jgi:hypothetical protein
MLLENEGKTGAISAFLRAKEGEQKGARGGSEQTPSVDSCIPVIGEHRSRSFPATAWAFQRP